MSPLTERNFGVLIAYLLPGLVGLWTLSGYSALVASWLGAADRSSATVGGFLYVTLASIAAGLLISALRWLVVDGIHHRTGVRQPAWDFSRLQTSRTAFEAVVQNHYRYYQFYGNTLIALVMAAVANPHLHAAFRQWPILGAATFLAAVGLLFVASRDALAKYYARTGVLLSSNSYRRERIDDERLSPGREEKVRTVQHAAREEIEEAGR